VQIGEDLFMRVALYQNSPRFGQIRKNVDIAIKAVEDFDFDILVFPELFASGYQFHNSDEAVTLADPAGEGYTFEALKELSIHKNALIIYGFPEKKGEKLYNSAAAILPDGIFHIYQKTHLFDSEKDIFSPGATGFFIFPFRQAKIGIMICFDWRFPESARKLALLGAQIICHPSNLVLPHCPDAMVIRALENNVFTITADRVGVEQRTGSSLKFIGHSRIIAPDGRILAELGREDVGFLAADIVPELADNKMVTGRNDLFGDRRPEYY
jgi:predicted amidohydrolase